MFILLNCILKRAAVVLCRVFQCALSLVHGTWRKDSLLQYDVILRPSWFWRLTLLSTLSLSCLTTSMTACIESTLSLSNVCLQYLVYWHWPWRQRKRKHTHTHTRVTALFPGLPGWAGTRKVKPIWILLKQETVSGSGISWAICKSASRSRQITMPVPQHSSFLQAGCPSCRPTNSVKALKAKSTDILK